MSIVTLSKVTVFGLVVERDAILDGLQRLGCIHLIPLQPPAKDMGFGVSDRYEDAQKALRYIMDVPRRRHQVRDATAFNLDQVVTAALANKQRRREVEDKKLFLADRLAKLAPWGHFILPDVEDLGGYQLWFYQIPHTKTPHLQTLELPWQIVGQDHLNLYLVVIAKTEPPADFLPVPRTHTGAVSPDTLERQLNQIEIELDDIQAEHEALSRWIFLLAKNLALVEDQVALQTAQTQAKDEDGIFMVQGWVPQRSLKRLDAFAAQNQLAFWAEPPQPEDAPPTLMDNRPVFQGGQDLVTFYEVPGYRTWDPSSVMFFSFTLFFAMILSDAGYALVMSYLRLFALGLASASLALTFNQLAGQVQQAVPGLGLFLSLLILILGHGINLSLGIISGFVHGLRLNYIEFFNWSLPEEGSAFQAFAKKENHL
jgi:V/A-type H+-transporting ATPase subunit I